MPWIPYKKNSTPEKLGEYFVIKSYQGTDKNHISFFLPIPPDKKIETMVYKQKMHLEENLHDRCVYVKYNAWEDKHGLEQKPDEIVYWYKLDPMPED